ncbi:phospholipase [Flavobacterium circumlabens]|uniref:Phospholipase n=1 Tax=Flavobacterium circumlabens TaxID=2133765 RepID=A0A4Y7UHA0_9FLAO|nr:dienelactone hydrolase family protein [Flavobacterium circumlabens]TCN59992.1 phospholipase/carboxylesterase [Flavobacterium circumlabens]TEB45232.1 phospholipase [Flavobacterium circumlabens]
MNTEIITDGVPLNEAKKALIMIHGRGAGAHDILSIARHLEVEDFVLIAPQAENRTWYPYSFLVPIAENEPSFSKSLDTIHQVVVAVQQNGIEKENIYFLGFSQGACLALEFTARNAAKYGGVVAFTGGLIGDKVYEEHYAGNFENTPIFIGTSDPDFHVPVERVNESEALLKKLGAAVTKKIYANMGHTISQDEIDLANQLVFSKKS